MSSEWALTADDIVLAAVQAGIAIVACRNCRIDDWIARASCRRTSLAGSRGADMTVSLENVTRTVDGIPTIRDVSLTLTRGTLSVLLGPTLSGKTSIMRLLAGPRQAEHWRVLVDGKERQPASMCGSVRWRWSISSSSIDPSLTVYETLRSPFAGCRQAAGGNRDPRARKRQSSCVWSVSESPAACNCSGGQQQRTAIARALVKGADSGAAG